MIRGTIDCSSTVRPLAATPSLYLRCEKFFSFSLLLPSSHLLHTTCLPLYLLRTIYIYIRARAHFTI